MNMRQPDTYKEVREFRYGHILARVYIPDITPEERERRMKEIGKAAAALVLSKPEPKENQ